MITGDSNQDTGPFNAGPENVGGPHHNDASVARAVNTISDGLGRSGLGSGLGKLGQNMQKGGLDI